MSEQPLRRPPWLKVQAFGGDQYHDMRKRLRHLTLRTVCEDANCPNRGECFSSGTATFLLMGPNCSRNCRFCNVQTGRPAPLDENEPAHVAELSAFLKLSHVVITSVTRDDLPDEGAGQFARTVAAVREALPKATVEILTPDFHARPELIDLAVSTGPTVFNHNVETVARMYAEIRPQADYRRSLNVLAYAAETYPDFIVKSGIMVGVGETDAELDDLFGDLVEAGVAMLTIGQYLAPSKKHHPVRRYYTPEEFDDLARRAETRGLKKVISGPLVRSSYRAGEALK